MSTLANFKMASLKNTVIESRKNYYAILRILEDRKDFKKKKTKSDPYIHFVALEQFTSIQ